MYILECAPCWEACASVFMWPTWSIYYFSNLQVTGITSLATLATVKFNSCEIVSELTKDKNFSICLEPDRLPTPLILGMLIVWLYRHQTEGSQSQYGGLLSVNNVLLGEREGGRQQDEQALLCHMASRLNMGHEGVVLPIVPLWVTCIHLQQLCLNSCTPTPSLPHWQMYLYSRIYSAFFPPCLWTGLGLFRGD